MHLALSVALCRFSRRRQLGNFRRPCLRLLFRRYRLFQMAGTWLKLAERELIENTASGPSDQVRELGYIRRHTARLIVCEQLGG
jgi:hypothetical protein